MYCVTEIPQKELQRTERQTNGPPADPSYDFAFRTPEYQRRENADSLGRVRGKNWTFFSNVISGLKSFKGDSKFVHNNMLVLNESDDIFAVDILYSRPCNYSVFYVTVACTKYLKFLFSVKNYIINFR